MSTIGEIQQWGRACLMPSEEALADAQALLCHVLKRDRAWLYAWGERPVTQAEEQDYRRLIELRGQGHPVAHLTGRRQFWTLDLEVNEHTLIPRPETEHLVEAALTLPYQAGAKQVIDLGCGSGAIALALAAERPNWQVLAVDASEAALAVTRRNAMQLGLKNVEIRSSNWFARVQGRFDLIVSNPPYIAEKDPHLSQGDLRFEPESALASGPDGLDAIRHIIRQAPEHLVRGGWLMLEHGFDQGDEVRALLQASGFVEVFTHRDLASLERASGGKYPLDQHGIPAQD